MNTQQNKRLNELFAAIDKYRALPREQFTVCAKTVDQLVDRAIFMNMAKPLGTSPEEVQIAYVSGIAATFEAGTISAEQAAEVTARSSAIFTQIARRVDELNAEEQGHVGGDTFPGEFAQDQAQQGHA